MFRVYFRQTILGLPVARCVAYEASSRHEALQLFAAEFPGCEAEHVEGSKRSSAPINQAAAA